MTRTWRQHLAARDARHDAQRAIWAANVAAAAKRTWLQAIAHLLGY